MPEPRYQEDYTHRQVEAARRVLLDIGQVLASFKDCMVVVGGWVPDLLMQATEEPHVGSIDVDLALDVRKLTDGRYADLLEMLVATRRYSQGDKSFQFITEVDLKDGEPPIQVEIEFLASKAIKLKKSKSNRFAGFRVLQFEECETAFYAPKEIPLSGYTPSGAQNTVRLKVASLSDFILMKCFALTGRDKPKDAYDICFCLDCFPGGIKRLVAAWKKRKKEKIVLRAIEILREKFASPNAYGPMQVAAFHNPDSQDERDMLSRRAFELVQKLLELF